MSIYKKIGSFVDDNDVTKTPIKVEMDKRGIIFIIQPRYDRQKDVVIFSKDSVPKLIKILQKTQR